MKSSSFLLSMKNNFVFVVFFFGISPSQVSAGPLMNSALNLNCTQENGNLQMRVYQTPRGVSTVTTFTVTSRPGHEYFVLPGNRLDVNPDSVDQVGGYCRSTNPKCLDKNDSSVGRDTFLVSYDKTNGAYMVGIYGLLPSPSAFMIFHCAQ